jgi:glutaredoxin
MRPGWWRFWRRTRLKDVHVIVYTRASCPLCDKASAFLERERERLGFSLDYIDVDRDDALCRQHGEWVPVVEVDGKVRFRGQVDEVLWRRVVHALER